MCNIVNWTEMHLLFLLGWWRWWRGRKWAQWNSWGSADDPAEEDKATQGQSTQRQRQSTKGLKFAAERTKCQSMHSGWHDVEIYFRDNKSHTNIYKPRRFVKSHLQLFVFSRLRSDTRCCETHIKRDDVLPKILNCRCCLRCCIAVSKFGSQVLQ